MTDKKKALKAFAGFLAAMLVMTFVSRAVYAKSLPLVQVREAKEQRLTRTLRCGGNVVPTAVKPVFLPEGLIIEQLNVSAGSVIEKGTELLKLDKAQLEEKALSLESEIAEAKEESDSTANDGTPVFAEPDMPVSSVNVKKGDTVEAGDVLFTVDTARLLILINELETERNSDIINRDGCNAAAEKADEDEMSDTAAQQRVQAAVYDCNIRQKQEKIDRYLSVFNSGGRICAPCGGAVTAVKVGSGDVTAQSAAVLIGGSESESSSVREKEKLLERYRGLIADDGIVKSGIDGTVTSVEVTAGQQTDPSAAVCIADNSKPMYFHAELSEEDAKQVSAGDSAQVVLHGGKLSFENCRIDAVVKQSGGTYTAIVPLESGEYLSGDIGELRIQATAEESSICVPSSAIQGGGNSKYLYVLKEEEGFLGEEYRAERVEVTTGKSNDSMTSLSSSGLSDGDKVICTDKKLTDGKTVRIIHN